MSAELEMSELDKELAHYLALKKAAGVEDIKCHVDVSGATRPEDFKRTLVNVFKQEEARKVKRVPLSALASFKDLVRLVHG